MLTHPNTAEIDDFSLGKIASPALSPAIQSLIDKSRADHERQSEAFRAVARGIIADTQHRLATALKVDPRAFAKVPDSVLDQLHTAAQTAKALKDTPGTTITFDFSSEVTVNGVRVPDEE